MNKAKSYKIIFFIAALFMCVFSAFGLVNGKTAKAVTITASNYFSGSYRSIELKDDNIVVSVADTDSFSFYNNLVYNDLALELAADTAEISALNIKFNGTSYGANGNLNGDGGYDKTIVNELTVNFDDNKVVFNDKETAFTSDGNLDIKIAVENGFMKATVEDAVLLNDNEYYRIGAKDKYNGAISFRATLKDDVDVSEIAFVSIDQNYNDVSGAFKQTFALDENGSFSVKALPRVVLADAFFNGDPSNVVVYNGEKYEMRTTALSFTGAYSSSVLFLQSADDYSYINSSAPKTIYFRKQTGSTVQNSTFNVCVNTSSPLVCETYGVTIKDKGDNNTAPVYAEVGSTEYDSAEYQKALDAFTYALNAAITEDYDTTGTSPDVHSIRVGTTVTVPSFADLVKDDTESYENLSHTLYYKTPSSTAGNTSLWRLTLSEIGDYEIYVVFKDKEDGAMEKSDFYTADGQTVTAGKYYDENAVTVGNVARYGLVFRFRVEDDAPLSVEAAESQADGFLNVRYTASQFDIKANSGNTTYKLYYNSSVTADTTGDWKDSWTEISTDDTNYSYDGKLTFTPAKTGSYAIECSVTSGTSAGRYDYATSVIRVKSSPKTVEVDDHWLENHVWSVVFLSVGTLSLIAALVLLFVKPKEKTEVEDDE